MVELKADGLEFTFPEVHRKARLRITFQRTLRIPDDGRKYPLPPGLGAFPLRHVDDFRERVPEKWIRHGGVMLPMYQSEALWIHFDSPHDYPFAVKVGTGKIDAVTGDTWQDGLRRRPQDYVVVPEQPWLDGYCVEKGVIRQFVAMPLGSGYSVEEQLTGDAEHGGIQLVVYPLKASAWRPRPQFRLADASLPMYAESLGDDEPDMGLAPGGRMKQEVYDDDYGFGDWDTSRRGRCFVHLANALTWHAITGAHPPHPPLTAEAYTRAGLPWFEYYDADRRALEGADRLAGLESVARRGERRGEKPLPENRPVEPDNVVGLAPKRVGDQVREGVF